MQTLTQHLQSLLFTLWNGSAVGRQRLTEPVLCSVRIAQRSSVWAGAKSFAHVHTTTWTWLVFGLNVKGGAMLLSIGIRLECKASSGWMWGVLFVKWSRNEKRFPSAAVGVLLYGTCLGSDE